MFTITLHDPTDSPFLSSGPRVVHDPLRSPEGEGPETATSDVLRDLLVQKRHVLLSKLQSQVTIYAWRILSYRKLYNLFWNSCCLHVSLYSLISPFIYFHRTLRLGTHCRDPRGLLPAVLVTPAPSSQTRPSSASVTHTSPFALLCLILR